MKPSTIMTAGAPALPQAPPAGTGHAIRAAAKPRGVSSGEGADSFNSALSSARDSRQQKGLTNPGQGARAEEVPDKVPVKEAASPSDEGADAARGNAPADDTAAQTKAEDAADDAGVTPMGGAKDDKTKESGKSGSTDEAADDDVPVGKTATTLNAMLMAMAENAASVTTPGDAPVQPSDVAETSMPDPDPTDKIQGQAFASGSLESLIVQDAGKELQATQNQQLMDMLSGSNTGFRLTGLPAEGDAGKGIEIPAQMELVADDAPAAQLMGVGEDEQGVRAATLPMTEEEDFIATSADTPALSTADSAEPAAQRPVMQDVNQGIGISYSAADDAPSRLPPLRDVPAYDARVVASLEENARQVVIEEQPVIMSENADDALGSFVRAGSESLGQTENSAENIMRDVQLEAVAEAPVPAAAESARQSLGDMLRQGGQNPPDQNVPEPLPSDAGTVTISQGRQLPGQADFDVARVTEDEPRPDEGAATEYAGAAGVQQSTGFQSGVAPMGEATQALQPQPTDPYNVVQQIVDQARLIRSEDGAQMVIRLNPEHLGELMLRVAVASDGTVNATFHTENAQVRGMLANSLIQLKQELAEQGIKVNNVEVYSGLSEDFFSNSQAGHQGYQEPQHSARSESADRAAFDEDAEALSAAAPSAGQDGAQPGTGVTEGVDYRV